MPNLASATGSWILSFAEMRQDEEQSKPSATSIALTGPVPLRKVDPKYPPLLASAKVEGEVVLYAVIRRDGSVDSIQLVRGIEPELDTNAMEALARWRFRPAERKGAPVELEAIVHIPFRAVPPLY
jgi:protein TonB